MSLNETNYLETKRKQRQRTFNILKHKCERLDSVREERRKDSIKIQKSLRSIQQEIQSEKRKYRKSIEQSKKSIQKSRLACEERKFLLGKQSRRESKDFAKLLLLQREEDKVSKMHRREQVRSTQREVHLSKSKVYETKKNQADTAKLERLFRQLADK